MRARDVISVFPGGGKILADFLGGGRQNMKKKIVCALKKESPSTQMTSLIRAFVSVCVCVLVCECVYFVDRTLKILVNNVL